MTTTTWVRVGCWVPLNQYSGSSIYSKQPEWWRDRCTCIWLLCTQHKWMRARYILTVQSARMPLKSSVHASHVVNLSGCKMSMRCVWVSERVSECVMYTFLLKTDCQNVKCVSLFHRSCCFLPDLLARADLIVNTSFIDSLYIPWRWQMSVFICWSAAS